MGLLNYITRICVGGKEAIARISSVSISDFERALLLEDQTTYPANDAPMSEPASTPVPRWYRRQGSVPGGEIRDSAELEELQARRIQREWGWSLVANGTTLYMLVSILICLSDPVVQRRVATVAATMIPGLLWNMGAYFSATASSGRHTLQKLVVDLRSNRRILLLIHLPLIFGVFSVGAFLACTLTLLYAASPVSAIVVAVPATIAAVAGVGWVIIGGVHSEDAMPGAGGV